jgi:hypothetical protein
VRLNLYRIFFLEELRGEASDSAEEEDEWEWCECPPAVREWRSSSVYSAPRDREKRLSKYREKAHPLFTATYHAVSVKWFHCHY